MDRIGTAQAMAMGEILKVQDETNGA